MQKNQECWLRWYCGECYLCRDICNPELRSSTQLSKMMISEVARQAGYLVHKISDTKSGGGEDGKSITGLRFEQR